VTTDPTNYNRAQWAGEAMDTFAAATGLDKSGDLKAEPATALADLLADLHHWADVKGIDWDKAVEHGFMHWQFEVEAERDV
jgi:hypothetical protein